MYLLQAKYGATEGDTKLNTWALQIYFRAEISFYNIIQH